MLVLQLNTSLLYSLLFVLHTLCGFKSISKSSCNAFRIFFTVICSKSATPRIAWTLVSITLWALSSFYLSFTISYVYVFLSLSLSLSLLCCLFILSTIINQRRFVYSIGLPNLTQFCLHTSIVGKYFSGSY